MAGRGEPRGAGTCTTTVTAREAESRGVDRNEIVWTLNPYSRVQHRDSPPCRGVAPKPGTGSPPRCKPRLGRRQALRRPGLNTSE